MHPATESILRYFAYQHLPEHLQEISKPFSQVAEMMVDRLENNDPTGKNGPEITAGLRKLLEAKDCFVRAAL